jgi:hypothetical protein
LSASDRRFVGFDDLDLLLDVAAQDDVGTAARHVGGDGDHLRTAGLGDDFRFAGVLLRVQDVVRQVGLGQDPDSSSEFSIEVVPTSTGWPRS